MQRTADKRAVNERLTSQAPHHAGPDSPHPSLSIPISTSPDRETSQHLAAQEQARGAAASVSGRSVLVAAM